MQGIEKENKIESIRVPSEGQNFKLLKKVFLITKSKGFVIEAYTDIDENEKKPIIEEGKTFKLVGSKFRIKNIRLKQRNKVVRMIMKAIAC